MARTNDDLPDDPHQNGAEGSKVIEELESYDLIDRARGGSPEARSELILTVRTYLLMIASQELDDALQAKVGASDLVQSALRQVQHHLDGFQGDTKETLLAWVRKILKNEIAEARRIYFDTEKRDVRREVRGDDSEFSYPLVDAGPSPLVAAESKEDAGRLRAAMGELSDDHRAVIMLRNWERLSFDEIGVRMNRSGGAAKKLWTRALHQLKGKLGDEP
ncbi:MAG: sigma-70 family RNA polymerase sigma factor [Planctomycetales bacterium]|nr:sigma-70 family RNA polymerase sigma factor [Planctomycetales bacterium]